MEFMSTPEASLQVYLLVSFALGLFLIVKCLIQMAFPTLTVFRSLEIAAGLAASVLVFVLCVDTFSDGGILVDVPNPLRSLIFITASAALVCSHFGLYLLLSRRRQLALQPVAWLAVALTLAATALSSHRYNIGSLRNEMDASFDVIEGELNALQDLVAVTDRGREVTLYRWVNPRKNASAVTTALAELENLRTNCHGWVFTGGQHLLWRDEIDLVLVDNGYQICEDPRPGDLIIYRNDRGEILHTGLVRAGLFGTTIESKWGLSKRFLHSPEMQPYSYRYTYYRSARHGHALTIRPARPATNLASL
jgi:hypothetical protein